MSLCNIEQCLSAWSATLIGILAPALCHTADRITALNVLYEKWTCDLQAAVGVNTELALATAQALDDLRNFIDQLETEQRPTLTPQWCEIREGAGSRPRVKLHALLSLLPS